MSKSSTPTSHAEGPTPSSTSTLRTAQIKPPGVEALGECKTRWLFLMFYCSTVYSYQCISVSILTIKTPVGCSAAPGLRTPLAVPCSYPSPFGMVAHPAINGDLSGAAAYTGLHNISPQMSAVAAAAVAAYGRTQVVPHHTKSNHSFNSD